MKATIDRIEGNLAVLITPGDQTGYFQSTSIIPR